MKKAQNKEIIEEKDKEIKRLKEKVKEWQDIATRINEDNNKLNYIIKDARELLNQEWYSVLRKETITKVKEILDKVGEE